MCIKKELRNKCKIIPSKCPYVLWCKLDKCLLGTEKDILLGGVYTSPEGSDYASQRCFNDIEADVLNINSNNDYIALLAGDFNAHTSTESGVINFTFYDNDNNSHDLFNHNDVFEYMPNCNDVLNQLNVPVERNSSDKSRINNHGHALLNFCKSLSYVIYNGRIGEDKIIGKVTNVRSNTIVDYCISDDNLIPCVDNFKILDFEPTLSDFHCPLSLSLIQRETAMDENNTTHNTIESNPTAVNERSIVWCKNCKSDLQNAIDDREILQLELLCNSNVDVNIIYDNIKNTIFNACTKCGIVKNYRSKNQKKYKNGQRSTKRKVSKTWFSQQCIEARKNYKLARDQYLRNKSQANQNDMKNKSNAYKSMVRKAKSKHRKQVANSILNLRSQNPKEHWSYHNGKKQNPEIPLNIEDIKTHFANLSAKNVDQSDKDLDIELHLLNTSFVESDFSNSFLNQNFTIEEISKVMKTLKSVKAAGSDSIINEVIIHSFDKLKHFWCYLFNRILDSGILPEEWLMGTIVPIYKNKGDKHDPGNYRGITLLSCSAKFFTAVLNNRLRCFSDHCNILLSNQAGFRPNHATTDHIFVLKTFSDLIRYRKRKLFCAFVDYEKAFDKVRHTGLWVKLLRNGIGGKLIQVLMNMYKGITSCIKANSYISSPFNIFQGVRQGENLSPFLFALYVNDLEEFFKTNESQPVDLGLNFDERINDYLKYYLFYMQTILSSLQILKIDYKKHC